MKKTIIFALMCSSLLLACSSSSESANTDNSNNGGNSNIPPSNNSWLIPVNEVKDGGPGKDGIPSIDNPVFINANEASFIRGDELIVGIILDGQAKAYPHKILDWHEIVNDNSVTINYCPLTGSALGWKSYSNKEKTTFGVSGLLYNSNLILYDRNTDSNWSQMRLQCVNGALIGDTPEITRIIETNWLTWQALYPNTKILSLDTGFSRDYNRYPYGDYKINHQRFIFTASPSNSSLPSKERVFAIIEEEKSKAYQFSKFKNGKAFKDLFNGKEHLVVGNEHLITAFKLDGTHANLEFEYDFNDSKTFFKDNENNTWNVFGEAISGPRTGEVLDNSKAMVSFWFALAAFYPNPEIYNEP
ncbi:DUF3179 domain-containing protein [Seonamhaeicola sp.]|uniref:DUF3179 domain-containing protein n=1 Tax=Seonamhaeicola sp. TaxID=1912245 RepID=UPI002626EFCB|nr:DUF3179 domain-containing protein [Seonamhaeicola sp.]